METKPISNIPPYIFYKEYSNIEELMKKLSELTSEIFIAGGCPRDIYLDIPFSDIDIYTASDCNFIDVINLLGTYQSIHSLKIQVEHTIPVQYKSKHISAVISFVYRDIPFQIIITKLNTRQSILQAFAVGLSQFYFEGRNIYFTLAATKDMSDRTLTVNPSIHVNSHYIKKISKKFPDHEVIQVK